MLKAAKLLGVAKSTVQAWLKKGLLKGTLRKGKHGSTVLSVDRSSLRKAFVRVCEICGRRFVSRGRPLKSRYCSKKHRMAAYYMRKRTSSKPYRMRPNRVEKTA